MLRPGATAEEAMAYDDREESDWWEDRRSCEEDES